jgi:hypothetical protein
MYVGRQRRDEEGTEKIFLSPRKHTNIPKIMTNLGDLHKDVLCRSVFEYYDRRLPKRSTCS